jgi:hypothetical protein
MKDGFDSKESKGDMFDLGLNSPNNFEHFPKFQDIIEKNLN